MDKEFQMKRTVVCGSCGGQGGSEVVQCSACGGRGSRQREQRMGPFVQIVQEECRNCGGSGQVIPKGKECRPCNGKGTEQAKEMFKVRTPSGVQTRELRQSENNVVIYLYGFGFDHDRCFECFSGPVAGRRSRVEGDDDSPVVKCFGIAVGYVLRSCVPSVGFKSCLWVKLFSIK